MTSTFQSSTNRITCTLPSTILTDLKILSLIPKSTLHLHQYSHRNPHTDLTASMVKVLENKVVDLDIMPNQDQQKLMQQAQTQLDSAGYLFPLPLPPNQSLTPPQETRSKPLPVSKSKPPRMPSQTSRKRRWKPLSTSCLRSRSSKPRAS